jgi:myosin-crossreactive antigen
MELQYVDAYDENIFIKLIDGSLYLYKWLPIVLTHFSIDFFHSTMEVKERIQKLFTEVRPLFRITQCKFTALDLQQSLVNSVRQRNLNRFWNEI